MFGRKPLVAPIEAPVSSIYDVGNFDFDWDEKKPAVSVKTVCADGSSDKDVDMWQARIRDVDAAQAQDEASIPWRPSSQVKLIIALQCFIVFVVAMDMTILTTSLPGVGLALQLDTTQAFWIATSYLLANTVCQPTVAALADIWGRRSCYWAAVLFFTLGSILCSAAHNIGTILAGRVMQGIGGGSILSVNLIILSDIVPLRQRSQYQGYMQLVFSLGTNIAPIVGGALVSASWRWLFYINLPFCAIGLAAIPFMLKYQRPSTSTFDKLSQMDWIGSILIIASTTSLLVGLSWGGNQYDWLQPETLLPIILGAVGVVVTVIYEAVVPTKPFLQLRLFNSVSAGIVYICTMLQALLMFSEAYYLTLYILSVKLLHPVAAGTILLAFGITVVPVSGIMGAIITRTGKYRTVLWAGYIISTLGAGLLMLLDVQSSTPEILLLFIVAGIGQGLLFISLSVASQASCESKDVAFAASTYSFFRSFGLCLGVTIGGTVFQIFLRTRTAGMDGNIASNAVTMAYFLSSMADDANRRAIIAAYAWAFRMLFAVMTGISAFGMLLSFFIKEHALDQALDSEHKLRMRSLSMS